MIDWEKRKAYQAQWRREHRERLSELSKDWREAHPDYWKNKPPAHTREWRRAHPYKLEWED